MGLGRRFSLALRCFFSILLHGRLPQGTGLELGETAPAVAPASQVAATRAGKIEKGPWEFDRAVQVLALLQREGRLIDFLAEDVTPYPDAQLGAAVRSVHESCRQALERYLKLEPIITSEEDQPVTVQPGFDPASIKVIGNVIGKPPLRGLLRHRGWRATQVNLPSLPEGEGRSVVAPAEVEIP